MKNTFGMPGPGGSLGTCALCGAPFLTEIILNKRVKSIEVNGCNQTLYGHDDCIKRFRKRGTTFEDLPDASPLKQEWLRQKSIKTPEPNPTP